MLGAFDGRYGVCVWCCAGICCVVWVSVCACMRCVGDAAMSCVGRRAVWCVNCVCGREWYGEGGSVVRVRCLCLFVLVGRAGAEMWHVVG